MKNLNTSITPILLLVLCPLISLGQRQTLISVCRRATFAALKPLPKLDYDCPEGLGESDDKILKLPARVAELKSAAKELESFTDASWWQADVDELSACDLHGKAGALSAEEKQKFEDGDYQFQLEGNHQIRLVLLADPCYQTGYNGANTFLLYRKAGKVFVTQVLDGYYSRLDNSIGISFANLNGQPVIEISTANTMTPHVTDYFYMIDPRTNKAVPKKIFKVGQKLTNEMTSAIIVGEPSELGLPRGAKDMTIVNHNRLLPSFSAYAEVYVDGDGAARKLRRTDYRWNGRFYVPGK